MKKLLSIFILGILMLNFSSAGLALLGHGDFKDVTFKRSDCIVPPGFETRPCNIETVRMVNGQIVSIEPLEKNINKNIPREIENNVEIPNKQVSKQTYKGDIDELFGGSR